MLVLDHTRDGLRHRKWIIPARTYRDGVTAERHYYVVGDDPFAVSFTVGAGRYPNGYGPDEAPSGLDVSWHREDENNGKPSCLALSRACCIAEGSGLDAEEWYAAQPKGYGGFVSDDAIFAYLCAYYREHAP